MKGSGTCPGYRPGLALMSRYPVVLFLILMWQLTGCAAVPLSITVDAPPQPAPVAPVVIDKRPVVGIALGSGATRGFAHVGVLNALERNGIVPDIVVGTSAGAVTGVLYAGGIRGERLEDVALQLRRAQLADWSYTGRGLIRGVALQNFINARLGNRRIEELETVFAATATDLDSGALVVFTRGDAGLAVRASSTIPGLVNPVTINGRDYVDGGLVTKVPVQIARQLGADFVIAVDVSRPPREHVPLDNAFPLWSRPS